MLGAAPGRATPSVVVHLDRCRYFLFATRAELRPVELAHFVCSQGVDIKRHDNEYHAKLQANHEPAEVCPKSLYR